MGITSVRDPVVGPAAMAAYRALRAQDRLPLRTAVLFKPSDSLPEGLSEIDSWTAEPKGDERLRFWGVKLFCDGGIIMTNTGLMHDPYLDKPGFRGIQVLSAETLHAFASAANRLGFAVAIHGTGDAGIDVALDVMQRIDAERPIAGRRFAIEHANLPTPAAVAIGCGGLASWPRCSR